ncbi:MAG: UvrD-helicase domain-containing protein [Elusimicrobia bacterium]|nr:UvrD-helicase domain-containing protein [Elusimicrobiota bacterium]
MTTLRDEKLNPQQLDAAGYRGGPLLVVAGAGTGKTRVITHRIARLIEEGVPPGRILAVTFTNKAADEMRRRVEDLAPGRANLVWIHTFHAFGAKLLRQHASALKLPQHFTIYDADDQKRLVVEAMREIGLEDQKNKAGLYASLISRAKDDLLDAQSYKIHAMTGIDAFRQAAARIYEVYQAKLDHAGALDFGDLLMKSVELLRDHEDIRRYYEELFLHLMVDEYQDTNRAQYILTKTLGAKHRNVCCVGDEDQSIYSWRGADIRNILEFERDFKDSKVVRLEQNYRSTPNILNAATCVIANNRQRKPKTLWTESPAGEPVAVWEAATESEEARWVVCQILRLVDVGASLKDIAIFYRTNAQSRQFEDALRLARLPHRVVGAMRFYERKEVKDALAYARVALNPADSVSLVRILNVPPRGVGKVSQEALERFAAVQGIQLLDAMRREAEIPGLPAACRRACRELPLLIDGLRTDLETLPAAQAMSRVLERTGYWAWLEGESESDPEALARLNNLQELLNAAKEFEEVRGPSARLGDFLEGVSLQSDIDTFDARTSAITLMTVHLAKGLEFPAVFLTGLEEGLFPIGAGNSSHDELEEERRLCYVGMTRARERLFLTYAATRRIFGQTYSNLPSRFVLEARLMGSGRQQPAEAPQFALSPAGLSSGPSRQIGLSAIRPGMRVRHPEFGTGKIIEKSGHGEALKVTVYFDNGKTRKLMVRYAPLEPA